MAKVFFELDTIDQTSSSSLDFEEGVLVGASPLTEPEKAPSEGRVGHILLLVLLSACMALLVFRLGYLQLSAGETYLSFAEGNRLRDRVLLAPRGTVVDRFGEVLARNTTSFRLVVVPFDVPKSESAHLFEQVKALLKLEEEKINYKAMDKLSSTSILPIVLYSGLSREQAILFQTQAYEFPGYYVQAIPVRDYVSAEAFAHLLGTTGVISEDDKFISDPNYISEDIVGKTGLELQYEAVLKGQNGQDRVEVDATGKSVKSLGSKLPEPGQTLKLGIDKGLQEVLYREFAARGKIKGAAVALDVKTGEVRALVSVPSFNSNQFAQGISSKDYAGLLSDAGKPLFNRAVSAQLPPGSTVKPMVGLAALEEGVVSEDTVIVDQGKITVPNRYYPGISYDFVGWKRTGLGPVTIRSAVARSSDIYFYIVGGGHPSSQVKPLGIARISEYYRRFSLGKLTGLDLPGEKPGVVADPAWKAEFFKSDPVQAKWYLGDTYHVSIGQGDMLVTPLQVAVWTATIANGGSLITPHLATGILNADGKEVKTFSYPLLTDKVGSENNINIVQQAMRQTVLSGSAQLLNKLPITSAGKTGTSQFDASDPNLTHAWFTVYAPYEKPEIAISVLVEAGGEGHAVAVPITKAVLEWWSQNRVK